MKNKLHPYTAERKLTIDDLVNLREQYNNSGEFTDRSFMNDLFHGLDDIIEKYAECQNNKEVMDFLKGVAETNGWKKKSVDELAKGDKVKALRKTKLKLTKPIKL